MPDSYTEVYFPVLVQGILAIVIAAALIVLSYLLGKRVRNAVKDTPYESGITPTGDARGRFSVKFYLVAMLFILFDIEIIFLYPWAVAFDRLGVFGLVEMFLFVVTVLVAYAYVWRRGGLEWD